jgi:SAM-dependent methyltransferase
VTETDGRADDAAGADDAADAGPGVPDAPPDVPDAASRDARSKAADADVAAYWDGQYRAGGALWGETPSELAAAAVERLRQLGPAAAELTLLDLGCGYGRDDVALWRALGLAIVGVDGAQRAVEMARAALPAGARIDYRRGDFTDAARVDNDLWDGPGDVSLDGPGNVLSDGLGSARAVRTRFDVVYSSNVYQLLGSPARAAFRAAVRDLLAPGGLFFMSTLSAVDPQYAGHGRPVPGEPDSFVERRYLHLCRREELAGDFGFLAVERLDELAYVEERPGGEPHHHVSWLLVGRAP